MIMLFNSYIFIFIFLPLTLLGWYLFNHLKAYGLAKLYLAGMSLWFYGYFNSYYLAIIVVSIAGNYLLSLLLERLREKVFLGNPAGMKFASLAGLTAGLFLNLGLLFYFKYYDFFFENINLIFHTDFHLKHILLPLGISFFTFQQLSFIIDRCTGKAQHYSFIDYLTFVTFFPQLVAGPIVLYKEMMPQFEDKANRRLNVDNFAKGIALFTLGLGKKVLLADVLAIPANYGFEQTAFLDTPATLFVILAYTFEIYFDFSGYSDMAIGLGKMFNIELPVNFHSPYKACSVKELWQRWHMTLSRFFIQYVYIPLGGSRKGKIRTIGNTFMVFFLSGLWHGANWTFILWGIYHALLFMPLLLLNKNRRYTKNVIAEGKLLPSFKEAVQMFSTFFLVLIGWIIFRSNDIGEASDYLARLFSPSLFEVSFPHGKRALIYCLVLLIVEWIQREKEHALQINKEIKSPVIRWGIYYILILIIVFLQGTPADFIYFQF